MPNNTQNLEERARDFKLRMFARERNFADRSDHASIGLTLGDFRQLTALAFAQSEHPPVYANSAGETYAEAAARIVREFRPNGSPIKEQELARYLERNFAPAAFDGGKDVR